MTVTSHREHTTSTSGTAVSATAPVPAAPEARPVPGAPATADVDLHGYVLARLDAHLTEMHTLRHELTRSRPTSTGSRLATAAATTVAAQRYAEDVIIALRGCD